MSFLAGTAATNITPPLGVRLAGSYLPRTAEDVIDELHAKALAVSDRTTSAALVVCDLIAIMSNGCSGDINNHDYGAPRHPLSAIPRANTRQVADVCAAEAVRLWREEVEMRAEIPVGVTSEEVQVKKRHIPQAELAEARAAEAAGGDLKDREFFWKWQKLRVDELPDTFPTQLQALRIGDVGLVGLPGEIFVEIGLQIKAASPFPYTMPVELANG